MMTLLPLSLRRQPCHLLPALLLSLAFAAPVLGQVVVTSQNDSGPGSLRQAVIDAAASETITFDASVETITLTSGEIVINKDLTIDGAASDEPVVLSGNNDARIFNISGGTTVNLTALTLTLGRADEAGDGADGGAITSAGTLIVTRCTFSDNNASGQGGAIKNLGSVTLRYSTLSGNTAGQYGGGLSNWGTAEVNNSTLSGNTSANQAGGIYNRATLTVNNSTLSGNSASFFDGIMNGGPATIRNSTLVGPNTQLYNDNEQTLHLSNTIVDDTDDTEDEGGEVDCENLGTLGTNVSNLVADGSCSPAYQGDPLLGPLADNGGFTWTHLPLATSPALDRGDAATCAALPGGDLDQRGLARADGDDPDGDAQCDIGAAEAQPSELPVELSSFTATVDDGAVVLAWQTASETNNAGFEVQHAATDAVGTRYIVSLQPEWPALAFVEGRGTTTEAQTYTYRADGLAPGVHRFRLKQVDYDGAFEYSPEVEVVVGVPGTHLLTEAYPNPFNPQTHFSLSVAAAQHVSVAVYDALGRRVARLFEGPMAVGQAQAFTFDAAGLPGGVYVVQAAGETFRDARRLVLLK